MAAAAILKFTLMATTRSLLNEFDPKFGIETKKDIPKTVPSDFTSEKFQDGGGHRFENWFNGYISVAMAYIWTKFYTGTKNLTPQAILPSKFNFHKIQVGGSRHFEILFNGRSTVIVEHIRTKFGKETRNKVRKTVLRSDFTSEKIQDGGGRHFENWFKGYISG